MTIYSGNDVIPLSFSRVRAGSVISGLSVTVDVKNAKTGAVLLSSTSAPEVGSTGIYTYNWTHGLTQDTECLVTYTVDGSKYVEYILISASGTGGRTA